MINSFFWSEWGKTNLFSAAVYCDYQDTLAYQLSTEIQIDAVCLIGAEQHLHGPENVENNKRRGRLQKKPGYTGGIIKNLPL